MGAKDPRLDHAGKQDFWLTRMFSAWKKVDDPPQRVKLIPMPILLRVAELAGNNVRDKATIDCIWMAFYFLLRPAEYANATGDAKHPFRLKDVQFKIGALHIFDVLPATFAQLSAATYISLTFTTQKNGFKGEQLAHASNGQPFACPVRATLRCVAHLKHHHAPATTPLHVYFDDTGHKRSVFSAMITSLLRELPSPFLATLASTLTTLPLDPFGPAEPWLCSSVALTPIKFESLDAGAVTPCFDISMDMHFLSSKTTPISYLLGVTTLSSLAMRNSPIPSHPVSSSFGLSFDLYYHLSYWWCQRGGTFAQN